MTLESLMSRLDDELSRSDGPVDVRSFVNFYYPDEMTAGQLVLRAFDARLVRGRLQWTYSECSGHISAIVDRRWGFRQ